MPVSHCNVPFCRWLKKAIATFSLLSSLTLANSAEPALDLSQEQAVALALEKNFSIAIEQINPEIQQQTIRQEKAAFDPNLSAAFSEQVANSDGHSEHYRNLNAGIEGRLPTGTTYNVGLQTEQTNDSSNPYHSAFAGITLSQSLLRGFGFDANWASVRIADRQHRISQWELKQTSLDVMLQVIYAYNQYFLVLQNAEIAKQNQELARQLVEDNRKRIEQGMMSPVDIAVAEAELAVREERVLQTEGSRKIQENALKNLIFNNYQTALESTISIQNLPEAIAPDVDLQRDFALALEEQPEIRMQQIHREIQQLQLEQSLNAQRIELTLNASYGVSGSSDSLSGSIRRLGKDDATDTSLGLSMSVPLFNRRSRAQTTISRLNLRQADLSIEQMKQSILLDLHSAIIQVETNWKRIQASRKAIELSEKMLEAEQKKLQAGTSSTFVVLRLQNDVADAQIREYQTISDYNLSLAQLARLKGLL